MVCLPVDCVPGFALEKKGCCDSFVGEPAVTAAWVLSLIHRHAEAHVMFIANNTSLCGRSSWHSRKHHAPGLVTSTQLCTQSKLSRLPALHPAESGCVMRLARGLQPQLVDYLKILKSEPAVAQGGKQHNIPFAPIASSPAS